MLSKLSRLSAVAILSQGINAVSIFLIGTIALNSPEESSLWLLILGANIYMTYFELGLGPLIQRWTTYSDTSDFDVRDLWNFSSIVFIVLSIILTCFLGFLYFEESFIDNRVLITIFLLGIAISMRYRFAYSMLMGLNEISIVQHSVLIFAVFKFVMLLIGILMNQSLIYFVLLLQALNSLQYVYLNRRLKLHLNYPRMMLKWSKIVSIFNLIWPLLWRSILALIISRIFIEEIIFSILNGADDSSLGFLLRYGLYISSFSMIWLSVKLPSITLDRIGNTLEIKTYIREATVPLFLLFIGYGLLILYLYSPFNTTYGTSQINDYLIIFGLLFLERLTGICMHIFSTSNKEPWYLFFLVMGTIYLVLRYINFTALGAYLVAQSLLFISVIYYVKTKEKNLRSI